MRFLEPPAALSGMSSSHEMTRFKTVHTQAVTLQGGNHFAMRRRFELWAGIQ